MPVKLMIYSLLSIILVISIILYILKKGRINIKYAVVWLLSFFIIFLMILIPGFLSFVTNILGFDLSSNLIFVFFIAVLIFINISLTVIVSGLNNKIRLLIQEVSILKKEVKENETKK